MKVKTFGYATCFSFCSHPEFPLASSIRPCHQQRRTSLIIPGDSSSTENRFYIYFRRNRVRPDSPTAWRDRLMRMKREGYNCVSTYIFWDAHEPIQGQYNFTGNLDLDAWATPWCSRWACTRSCVPDPMSAPSGISAVSPPGLWTFQACLSEIPMPST